MSGILNVATRALMANQAVLQTAGNNIANVNTPGYSRQSAVLQTADGQFTGGGYIGKGVDVATITRAYSDFLIHQSALAGATSAGDSARAEKFKQLEAIFPGGISGLGASVNDMINAFSDVSNAPTDLTARTVALTRVSEAASRMRSASQSLDDLQSGVTQEITQKLDAINSLAISIARVNDRIAKAQGSGQTPNDLLDQRDQLVRDLNQYVQTSSIMATDGAMGIFLGGSQALVLGTSAATLTTVFDDFNDPLKTKVTLTRQGQSINMDENILGGGQVSALLRFQNTDLAEGRNLQGRLTLAITTSMNDQHRLGLDLDGKEGGNLFTPTDISTVSNILAAATNTGVAGLSMSISDVTQFAASDYEINFTTGTSGIISRKSDGVITNFDFGTSNPVTFDGLKLTWDGSATGVGDRFLLKPFSTSASTISAEFSTPRALAVASPVAGKMGTNNTGSLQLANLQARSNPPMVQTSLTPVVLTFTGPNSYTRSDEGNVTSYIYTSGRAIEANFPIDPTVTPYTHSLPLTEWSVTLQGSPKAGDSFTIFGIKDMATNNGTDYKLNTGNASAMTNLRDTAMFDGSALTDGYANLIAQIGIRTQSANFSA
ncbi:MAG: flagellar hook-associated protein FlgK, partial [Rhodoferax sp.]|nr:flagellar hook-associated protein FlgK [Rhodoferax sp.]